MAEICRKAGINKATYFNWNKKYARLLSTEVKRLKQLNLICFGAFDKVHDFKKTLLAVFGVN